MIKIIVRMASSITHAPHLFSMKHVFLEKERKKKEKFEHSSWDAKVN